MAISPSTPITGSAQTGFTSPTFTIAAMLATSPLAKQWAVTALGGTQTGATPHSASNPFTLTYWQPPVFPSAPKPNPSTNTIGKAPLVTHKALTRKGMPPLTGQAPQLGMISSSIQHPAGADLYSPGEIRSMISAHIGLLNQISAGLGDTVVTGVA